VAAVGAVRTELLTRMPLVPKLVAD
jgi:hypothetical protein